MGLAFDLGAGLGVGVGNGSVRGAEGVLSPVAALGVATAAEDADACERSPVAVGVAGRRRCGLRPGKSQVLVEVASRSERLPNAVVLRVWY